MVEEMNAKNPKVDRRLTTINGVDYWDAQWSSRKISHVDRKYDVLLNVEANPQYVNEEINEEVNEEADEKFNKELFKRMVLATPLIYLPLTLFIILQFNTDLILQLCASLIITSLLFIATVNLADEIYKKIMTKKTEDSPMVETALPPSESFTFFGPSRGDGHSVRLSEKMGEDIARQLNTYRETNDVESYMEIVQKLVSERDEKIEALKREKERENAEKELKDAEAFAQRAAKNPFLSGAKINGEVNSLCLNLDKFANHSGVKNRINFNGLNSSLDNLKKMEISGREFDARAYQDCRRELETVTERFNETLAAGLELSPKEVRDYQDLVDSCTIVLERVSKGAIERRSDDATISAMFIRDKYGVTKGDVKQLESSLSSREVDESLIGSEQAVDTSNSPGKVDGDYDPMNVTGKMPGDTTIVNGKWRL